ncbi:MAG: hypothetical protein EPN84_11365 [Legionella sp.]|nr:MAG: hypothetical protein EPN84_11365 [Legionella sp.]
MQKLDTVSLEIEHLLFDLTLCVNDLHSFSEQLSIDDTKQVELNLNKLESLISFVRNHKNKFKLTAV